MNYTKIMIVTLFVAEEDYEKKHGCFMIKGDYHE
jgi:hypothetical protein